MQSLVTKHKPRLHLLTGYGYMFMVCHKLAPMTQKPVLRVPTHTSDRMSQ